MHSTALPTLQAEGQGFEPWKALTLLAFKASAFNRSANLPKCTLWPHSTRRPPGYKPGALLLPWSSRVPALSHGLPAGRETELQRKRREPGSNRRTRLCRPVASHSPIAPWMPCPVRLVLSYPKKSPSDPQGVGTRASGRRGIRTLGTLSRTHAFQACPFNHSGTLPYYQAGRVGLEPTTITLTGCRTAIVLPAIITWAHRDSNPEVSTLSEWRVDQLHYMPWCASQIASLTPTPLSEEPYLPPILPRMLYYKCPR